MKRRYTKKYNKRGAALLIVLFIVMTITVLSLGFMSRCDTELACGQNMAIREQTNSLAYSGLEHAKGLILYPQDTAVSAAGYWQGASAQQLTTPGNDYYDVSVAMHNAANDSDPTYRCTYDVNCEAYRLTNGTKVARSSVKGQLRLDPCIAYREETGISIPSRMTINGDVYCNGSLLNLGVINGDVFASAFSGTASGQTNAIAQSTVSWPNVTLADFTSKYSVQSLPATVTGVQYGPYSPLKVCYYNGALTLGGNAVIEGMLVVNGDLQISGTGNTINAGKNLPALYVTGDVIIQDNAELTVNGLAVVENRVNVRPSAGNVNVYGGLFVRNGVFETAVDSSNANTAFLYNGPTWSGGQVNGALQFDGIDDYLQTANNNGSTNLRITGDYTFSVWVKADPTQKAWAGIFSKCSSDSSTNYWTLQFDSAGKKLIIYHPTGSWDTNITLNDIKNAWHNIKIVRSGSTMRSYLDTVQQKSETWLLPPGWGNGHLNIGVDRTAGSACTFKGLIDELKIYKSAATGGADSDLPPNSDMLGYWTFDKSGNGTVNVYAAPHKAAVIVWSGGNATRWGQAGGVFFRSIKRN